VTGEALSVKTLYEDETRFYPMLTHVFGTNRLPNFSESDLGVKRRLGMLLFLQSIPKHIREKTKTLVRDIFLYEYDYAVNFAIQGGLDLLREGEYTLPQSSVDAVEKWMTASDGCKMWASRMVDIKQFSTTNNAGLKCSAVGLCGKVMTTTETCSPPSAHGGRD
jgi:phage/plasmid-associated DNA primase